MEYLGVVFAILFVVAVVGYGVSVYSAWKSTDKK